jgi:hypothetical protein
MDWLTFIVRMTSALAWPLVVIVLIVVFRNHLAGLARRIQELRLPGGTKAKFVKELEEVRRTSQAVEITKRFTRGNVRIQEGRFLSSGELAIARVASTLPESVIFESYNEIEQVILRHFEKLPESARGESPADLIEMLFKASFLDAKAKALYEELRSLKNTASHTSTHITPGEALEYREHATLFADLLSEAIDQFSADAVSPKRLTHKKDKKAPPE